jgi:hypothetical protein
MRLSPRERRILGAIEDDFQRNDPALAVTFTESRWPFSFRRFLPLSGAQVCLLVVALLALILLHSTALSLGPAGLAALTGVLIVPWLVNASRAHATSRSHCRRRRGRSTRQARA